MTSIKPAGDLAGPPMAISFGSTRELTTGNWRTLRPQYVTRPSPCNLDCPAGTDVRAFLARAADGDVEGAWHTIRRHNPLPGVCGRVCYHPCEADCNRAALDQPVAVHAIERAIADEARRRRLDPLVATGEPQIRRVGVVGAGPAGLSCAYQLALRGYPVTVFDEHAAPGGMLRYGIPAYRLPRPALDREIALLERMGITFVAGVRVGTIVGVPELSSFAALFLAVGAQLPRHSRIAGDHLPGIEPGLDLLRAINGGANRSLFGSAIIIGGGNTAIDTARVALRLGAEPTIVYRRGREEMPAHPDEVAQAEAEGVAFVFNAAPLRFLERDDRVGGVELQRMRPGARDASGRPAPEPIPGSTFTVRAHHVFLAIGEEVDVDALHAFVLAANGRLRADGWGRTKKPAVFAGGDAATGAGTVAAAIGSGRRTADAIDAWLQDRPLPDEIALERVPSDDLNLFYFQRSLRAVPRAHDTPRAVRSFDEIVSRLTWDQTMAEARRCITCGACTSCDNCYVFCPDAAIVPERETGTYAIDLTHCKGCGICAAECPRGAVVLVPEEPR